MEYGNIVRQYGTWLIIPFGQKERDLAWTKGAERWYDFQWTLICWVVYVGTHNIVVLYKLQEQEKGWNIQTKPSNPTVIWRLNDCSTSKSSNFSHYRQATPFSVWSKSRPKFKATSLLGNITSILSVRSRMSGVTQQRVSLSSWNNPCETYSDSIYLFSGKGASLQLNSVIHWKLRTQ